MKKMLVLGMVLGYAVMPYAQDSADTKIMEPVTIGVNKWEQPLNEVPNKVIRFNRPEILHNSPQTTADLLSQTGSVFVQKSQLGGGSPMIRGFATNRVLIVVDGVRMNNAIYRSGNLQNVISVDALGIESGEVIFGPGSLIYGSDAIGGVMDFRTLTANLSSTDKTMYRGSALTRYSSANHEKTIHADFNAGSRKLAFLGSFSHSDFGDLRMGKHGGQHRYLRPEYVERIGDVDSIVTNKDPRVQKYSGYAQTNFLGKLRYMPNEKLDLQYSFTYSHTGDAPRYDRLIQYRNGKLRFAEWYYGPMIWEMHQVQALFSSANPLWDKMKLIVAYQDYEESRNDRARGNVIRTTQQESVRAISVNADAVKNSGRGQLFYGLEHVYNKVGSSGFTTHIISGDVAGFASRYPDGSEWTTSGAYASYKLNLDTKFTIHAGLRYAFNALKAEFNNIYVSFPYQSASLQYGALTGNLGLVGRLMGGWQLNITASTGYRMPNVDDMGKLFESSPGNITVPNPGLKPEYAWNLEAGISKSVHNKLHFEANAFFTYLENAIVRRPFQFNGMDSIEFGGSLSRVEALQNAAYARVWGVQAGLRYHFNPAVFIQSHANWINGKETDEEKNEQVALRHAPPFYGSTALHFKKRKLHLEVYAQYNGEVANSELAPSEQSKTDIYAQDANGLPYSPAWYTLNLKASWQFHPNLVLGAGWENITGQRYRPYSSGIVAAGSNFIISLRASFNN